MSQEDFTADNSTNTADTGDNSANTADNNTNTSDNSANTADNSTNTADSAGPKMISKPDANPILALLLTFVFHLGHSAINGQTRKWGFILLAGVIGSILCCLPGTFICILSLIDAYKTAERLKSGEAIPENEYSLPLLYKIVKILDKTATCSRAELNV